MPQRLVCRLQPCLQLSHTKDFGNVLAVIFTRAIINDIIKINTILPVYHMETGESNKQDGGHNLWHDFPKFVARF